MLDFIAFEDTSAFEDDNYLSDRLIPPDPPNVGSDNPALPVSGHLHVLDQRVPDLTASFGACESGPFDGRTGWSESPGDTTNSLGTTASRQSSRSQSGSRADSRSTAAAHLRPGVSPIPGVPSEFLHTWPHDSSSFPTKKRRSAEVLSEIRKIRKRGACLPCHYARKRVCRVRIHSGS